VEQNLARAPGIGIMSVFHSDLRGVVWDWGDTLMRDLPGQVGPMADWPHVEAMPGAASPLKAMSVYPVHCVGSNATESDGRMVAKALERVGLREHLTRFFTSLELGISKPDPGFYREIARALGIPTTSLMAVGNDLQKDIVPAKAVGMVTVFVSSEENLSSEEAADITVPDLSCLAQLFWDQIGEPDP
jgi:beta-phosphoglucomutase-like phosphatase (HAD superfamily)